MFRYLIVKVIYLRILYYIPEYSQSCDEWTSKVAFGWMIEFDGGFEEGISNYS